MTPNPRAVFYNKHINLIGPIIEAENVNRAKAGFLPVSPSELDAAIDELIAISTAKGGLLAEGIRFKPPQSGNALLKNPQPNQPAQIQGERFNFEVIKCGNGFLLNLNKGGKAETFIFKTREELAIIFDDVLFDEPPTSSGHKHCSCVHNNSANEKEIHGRDVPTIAERVKRFQDNRGTPKKRGKPTSSLTSRAGAGDSATP